MSSFKKAERKRVKFKMAITGPSGAGKTYSALRIAKGLCPSGKIAMIDTENGSGSLYADSQDMPSYDVIDLAPPFLSSRYMKLIDEAVQEGYDCLIIDSISHQWNGEGGIMDRKDKEQQGNPKLNSFALWAKYTPEHERFKQKLLQAPIHIIATMRSKQDYVLEENEKGKKTPKKIGMAPIQREGAEYEFTTVFDMTVDHIASASKDRTSMFDQQYFTPDEETGKKIREWLLKAKEVIDVPVFRMSEQEFAVLTSLREAANMPKEELMAYILAEFKKHPKELTKGEFDSICNILNERRNLTA
jgi:hypothetical protein